MKAVWYYEMKYCKFTYTSSNILPQNLGVIKFKCKHRRIAVLAGPINICPNKIRRMYCKMGILGK